MSETPKSFAGHLVSTIKTMIEHYATIQVLGSVHSISPLIIVVDNSTNPFPATYLNSYTPAVNDRIVALRYRNTYLVIGKFT